MSNQKFIHFLTMAGMSTRVTRLGMDALEIGEIGRAAEWLIAIDAGLHVCMRRGSGITGSGSASKKRVLLTLSDDKGAIGQLAVCLHSRASHGLKAALWGTDDVPADVQHMEPPWAVLLLYVLPSAVPAWLERACWALAWSALLESQPGGVIGDHEA